jgi:ADP-ribosylglycohydrolase
MKVNEEKVRAIVYGLAFGDSISSYSAVHRVSILAPRRVLRMRTLTEFADDHLQTTRPSPYTHAQPGKMLNPAPSDDSEWFAFTANALMNSAVSIDDAWMELARQRDVIRARTGTKVALRNLDQGSSIESAGHDNPHYFDDIACIRAIAAGILSAGSVSGATELAFSDARITHSEDGLWCAMATSALVAAGLSGASKEEAVGEAIKQLPTGSWSARIVEKAIAEAAGDPSGISRGAKLESTCVDRIYSFAISAPETLGLLFAHLLNSRTADEFFLATLLHKRNLDSLPALAGAIASLFFTEQWLPKGFLESELLLDGVCLPDLKGSSLKELSHRLAASSEG